MTQSAGPGAGEGAAPGGSTPTCYRHPDRPTRIRCTRCDRPICTECMIPASVGFQCPDDVREGNKGMRAATPRTVTGARAAARPGIVTTGLIAVNVALFAVQKTQKTFTDRFDLFGYRIERGEWYRVITAAFLHAGVIHLAVNMLSLYVIGTQVERLLGTTRFLGLYLVAAVGGSAASFAFHGSLSSSVGASGAIFGLIGALLVIVRRLRLDMGPLFGMLGLNLLLPVLVPGIDWRAHVGGLITGAVLAWAFTYAPASARRWVHPLATVAVLAVLIVLVLVRAHARHALGSSAPALPLGAQSVHDVR